MKYSGMNLQGYALTSGNLKSALPTDLAPVSRKITVCSKVALRNSIYHQCTVRSVRSEYGKSL